MTTETQAPDPAPVPAGFALIPLESSDALLRPFYECPPEELKLAWHAMHMIARKLHPAPAIPAPEGAQADERAAFETWAESEGFCMHRDGTEKYSEYHKTTTRWAWKSWQARAALAAPAPQAPAALTVQQIIDATVQIDVTQPAWVVKLARAIERAHGIPAPDQGAHQ